MASRPDSWFDRLLFDINVINGYNGVIMAVLNVRGFPDQLKARLRVRAARAGRSMEAEARAILADACARDEPRASLREVQAWTLKLYGASKPRGVADDLIRERRREARRE
jgi:plasmid stability protein